MNRQQELMRVFRVVNDTLQKLNSLSAGDRKIAIEGLVSVNERMSDFVISLLNKLEDAKQTAGTYQD